MINNLNFNTRKFSKMNFLSFAVILTFLCIHDNFVNGKPCSKISTCPPGWTPFEYQEGCFYLLPPVTGPPKVTITTKTTKTNSFVKQDIVELL